MKIGFVQGKGNSATKNDYSFEDKNPIGKFQYRLKQVDNNGNFKYYDAISVTAIPQDFSLEIIQIHLIHRPRSDTPFFLKA